MSDFMNDNNITEAERVSTLEKVAKARAWFIIQHPFFATLSLQMIVGVTRRVPTAGVNYTHMYFNPDFAAGLDNDEMKFLIAHEVFHPMFEHNSRRGTRDPMLWNIAADIVINEHLCQENIGTMPKGGIRDTAMFQKGNGSTEEIYALLEKQAQKNGGGKGGGKKGDKGDGSGKGSGNGSGYDLPWEDILEGSGDPAEDAANEADMKVRVSAAAQAAKMAGKMSANMQRLVGEALEPKINWKDVLRDFIMKARNDDRSWARPNRRFSSMGLTMPSVSGEQMGEILIAVDCSGSIGERELNEFAAEIRAIHEDAMPLRTHIAYFDSRVCHYDVFERDDTVKIAAHGGGGTAFSPVFRYAEKHDIQPVCCVFLTDLYCSDFGPEPEYPVLWITNGTDQAPWGKVIKM